MATGIGQIVTLLIYLFVYKNYPLRIRLSRRYLTRDFALDFKLYAIGIPATLNLALPSLLVSSLNTILAAFSQSYIVVLGIYYKLQTFLYLPANGIIQGMRPLIGFNYGAGEHERVKKIYNTTLVLNAGIMLGGTIICLTVPDVLMAFFTDNNVTVKCRGAGAAHNLCRVYRIGSERNCLRRAGRAWHGRTVACNFTFALCTNNYTSGMVVKPQLWRKRRLACLLAGRTYNRRRGAACV